MTKRNKMFIFLIYIDRNSKWLRMEQEWTVNKPSYFE